MLNNNKKSTITPLLMAVTLDTASLSIAVAGNDDVVELKKQEQQAQVKPVEKNVNQSPSKANDKSASASQHEKGQEKEEHAEGKCGG